MSDPKKNEVKEVIKNQVAAANTSAPNQQSSDDMENWTSDDVDCFAMGEGLDKKGKPRIQKATGTYLYSIMRRIKRRNTILHRFASATVTVGGDTKRIQGECLIYGSGSVNHKMRAIPEHTKVRLTYQGEVDVGQDSPMKNILVEWPKGTKLIAKAPPAMDEDNSDTDDVPF